MYYKIIIAVRARQINVVESMITKNMKETLWYIGSAVFVESPPYNTPKYQLQPIDKFFLVVTGTMKRGEIPDEVRLV